MRRCSFSLDGLLNIWRDAREKYIRLAYGQRQLEYQLKVLRAGQKRKGRKKRSLVKVR